MAPCLKGLPPNRAARSAANSDKIFSVKLDRAIDRFLELLKSWEAKYYRADYARLRDEFQWCQQRVVEVALTGVERIGGQAIPVPGMAGVMRRETDAGRIGLLCAGLAHRVVLRSRTW